MLDLVCVNQMLDRVPPMDITQYLHTNILHVLHDCGTPLDHIILECPITGHLQCAGRSTVLYVPPICYMIVSHKWSIFSILQANNVREVSIAHVNLSQYWLLQMLENDWCTYYCNFKDLVFRASMVLCIRQWPLQGPGLSRRLATNQVPGWCPDATGIWERFCHITRKLVDYC
jgi:hypothetical protein